MYSMPCSTELDLEESILGKRIADLQVAMKARKHLEDRLSV